MEKTVNPHVVCVMLTTNTRPKLMERAIRSFERQVYVNRSMLIFNTGDPYRGKPLWRAVVVDAQQFAGESIGMLRNAANRLASGADIICHWDDDDFSWEARISKQVQVLCAPTTMEARIKITGFNKMWFWREAEKQAWIYANAQRNYALGTSLCYWRDAWLNSQFDSMRLPGEDTRWLADKTVLALPSTAFMVASIHGQNTSKAYDLAMMRAVEKQGGEWGRRENMDAILEDTMRTT